MLAENKLRRFTPVRSVLPTMLDKTGWMAINLISTSGFSLVPLLPRLGTCLGTTLALVVHPAFPSVLADRNGRSKVTLGAF